MHAGMNIRAVLVAVILSAMHCPSCAVVDQAQTAWATSFKVKMLNELCELI